MTHKIRITEPKQFIDSLNIISKLVNEVVFKFNQDGLSIVAMDPANVAMVICNLKSAGFAEYKSDADATYGIDFSKLIPCLRRVKGAITLEFGDMVEISATGKVFKKFSVPIVDIEEKTQKIPELEFKATVKMESEMLADAIEDAALVGDACVFACMKGKFGIAAESELNKVKIDTVPSEVVVAETETITAKYAIEYLNKLAAGQKIAKTVTVRFGQNYPLKLEFKAEYGDISFILAPRVESS